jgi:hypothetical protein
VLLQSLVCSGCSYVLSFSRGDDRYDTFKSIYRFKQVLNLNWYYSNFQAGTALQILKDRLTTNGQSRQQDDKQDKHSTPLTQGARTGNREELRANTVTSPPKPKTSVK